MTDLVEAAADCFAGRPRPREIGVLAQRAHLLGYPGSGRSSCGGATRILRAADADVVVTVARPDDAGLVPAWLALAGAGLAAPDWPLDDSAWGALADASVGVPARRLTEAAAELGLACATVGEVTDQRPVLVDPLGESEPRALRGARVVNLGSLWAGPLAAHLLAQMGAEVTSVESTARPDGSRNTPEFFAALREGVDGVSIDFSSASGRADLARLLASADVVIEGSRPRALRQLGVVVEDAVSTGPQVWLSVTGYGRGEPHAARIGFGDDTAAAGGLVGHTAAGTVFLVDAIADPLTGLTVAATAADLLESGGRWMADVALARVAASMADPGPAPASTAADGVEGPEPLRARDQSPQ